MPVNLGRRILALSLAVVLGLVTAGPANATITFLNTWGTGGTGNSQFNTPIGVGIDPWTQDVLVVDQQNDRVQRFDDKGNYLDQWSFQDPRLVGGNSWDIDVSSHVNGSGRVYVTSPLVSDVRTVFVFESDGTIVGGEPVPRFTRGLEFTASGSRRYEAGHVLAYQPAVGSHIEFTSNPIIEPVWQGIGVSTTDDVYALANSPGTGKALFKFVPRPPPHTSFFPITSTQLSPPPGVAVSDFNPTDLDVSASDHNFIVDQFSGIVQKYDLDFNLIDSFGGTGSTDGLFNNPTKIEVAPYGFIYVTDTGNNRVQRFFDSDMFVSGTAYFDDPATGPIDVSIGSGSGLFVGQSQILGNTKGLVVGGTTEIASDGRLDILGDPSMFSTGDIVNNGLFNVLTSTIDLGTGLYNTGDALFIGTTVTGPVNSPAGSAINVIGQVNFSDEVSGAGGIFGSGTAIFNGGYSPGDSPAIVPVENSIAFGSINTLSIELGGLVPGEYDQLLVGEDATLNGLLDVSLLNPFLLSQGNEFLIMDIAGTASGQFNGLGEGDLVGNFGGEDLFITYAGGDGNDVVLFTSSGSAGVPEPSTLALLGLGILGLVRQTRQRRLSA